MNLDGEQAITCTDTVAETNSIINKKHSSKPFEILRKNIWKTEEKKIGYISL